MCSVRAKEQADRPKDREALPELRAIRDARAAGHRPTPGTEPPADANHEDTGGNAL